MVKRKKSRRIYFLDKKFQMSFILKFCALVIVSSLLTGTLVYFLSQRSTTVILKGGQAVTKPTADFLLPLLIQTIIIVGIIVAVATIILTLFISHKLAGPLYRFKKELDTVGFGYLSDNFSLREDDQFQDIAASMAAMVRGLKERISNLKNDWRSLKNSWQSLAERKPLADYKQETEEFKNIIAKIDKDLDYFKVE